ncbi:AbrB/MazE/SpoVT family DNA-binding domain-containing protein [Candidatus Daviesbacteria bacterium]|nr:AbrB/MazE/SpoVT family DNA-binding domain-containing protein [Candidatus Daviesbacteria bacterium]
MVQIATITGKKQLTIPAKIFERARLKIGQRVMVSEENGSLKITPAERVVEELAGSVALPKRWYGNSIKEVVRKAKEEHFLRKYHIK